MSTSKKIVLYSFAIFIALLLMADLGLSFIEVALLIAFLLLLMVLFMVVFMKQLKEKEREEEEKAKKKIQFEFEEIVESKTKVCSYCHTVNPKSAVFCKKCKRSLEDIVCPVCGHENPYDQKYCEQCHSILQNKKVHL